MESFQKRQDSLRNELLKVKNDKLLLNSVFEEHYIRGLVTNEKSYLKFELPFNLHGPDCGAPDCYTTELEFEISNSSTLKLPEKIKINGSEYGCVENQNWSNDFKLVESNEQMVNYYSAELKSNLYFTKKGRLIYFPHEKGKSISLKELDKMYENWEFDDAELAPYLSTVMTTMEYETFMDKK
tara:strand:- start:7 stop:555 length:549 start_codon:yes stop_codon:yes gene_type:complete